MTEGITIIAVASNAERRSFVDLAYRLNRGDRHWVPPLKSEVHALLSPQKNPWFGHARAQLFVARRAVVGDRGGRISGRISAHIDTLALQQPRAQGWGPGTGSWGMLEAEDGEVASALIAAAEDWLRAQGMERVFGPLSLSVWDEVGVLIEGFDDRPAVMLGHNSAQHQQWIEAAAYRRSRKLFNYSIELKQGFPERFNRIVAMGERNARITIRRVDKKNYAAEVKLIFSLINDSWSKNWGFVPLTDAEVAYASRKLKPLVREDLIYIAEVDGEAVAFSFSLPDVNAVLMDLSGSLYPFGWAKLLWWLRRPRSKKVRMPLMGVVKRLQTGRLTSLITSLMIEYSRRAAVANYGGEIGDIGWVLEDNSGMIAIADLINAKVNRVYQLYEKDLHPNA